MQQNICGNANHCRSEGSPERGISSLGVMGQGPGTFPKLFACRHVRLLVDSSIFHDVVKMFLHVRGFGKNLIRVCYLGEVCMDLLRCLQGL